MSLSSLLNEKKLCYKSVARQSESNSKENNSNDQLNLKKNVNLIVSGCPLENIILSRSREVSNPRQGSRPLISYTNPKISLPNIWKIAPLNDLKHCFYLRAIKYDTNFTSMIKYICNISNLWPICQRLRLAFNAMQLKTFLVSLYFQRFVKSSAHFPKRWFKC